AHARLPPDLAAQVVELCAVDVADRGDLDLLDLRRVERERPLYADAERLLPGGRAPRALEVDPRGAARLELREIAAQLRALEALDDFAHRRTAREGRSGMLANVNPFRAALDLEHSADDGSPRLEPPPPRIAGLSPVVAHQEVHVAR